MGLATFILALFPSWFSFNSSEAISFHVRDGWCDAAKQGFGIHCFGDFYYALKLTELDNPWSSLANAYPPITIFTYKIFYLINLISVERLGLVIFLLISLCALLLTLIHAHFNLLKKSYILTCSMGFLIITASPTIISIDRGSNQIFTIPLIYFFAVALLRNDRNLALAIGVILTLFKPQFGVYVLIFVVHKQWSYMFRWFAYALLGYLLSFLLYFKSFPENIFDWVSQIIKYQDYAEKGSIYPINLSISNLMEIPFRAFGIASPSGIISLISFSLLVLAIVAVARFGSNYSLGSNLLFISLIPIIFVSTAFHYYLIILIIPLLLILYETYLQEEDTYRSNASSVIHETFSIRIVASFTLVLLFIPWSIPFVLQSTLVGRGWSVMGINWIPGQFFLSLLVVMMTWQMFKRHANRSDSVLSDI